MLVMVHKYERWYNIAFIYSVEFSEHVKRWQEPKRVIGKCDRKNLLTKQNKSKSEMAKMIQSRGYPENDGSYTAFSRMIFGPISTGSKEETKRSRMYF